ncbi:MAG TPA: hypothetical protein VK631_09960, partial [Solirubrobacteraceae bacterium]|nr:hypothetical protein [Solirubrobacteraceae bacterium]
RRQWIWPRRWRLTVTITAERSIHHPRRRVEPVQEMVRRNLVREHAEGRLSLEAVESRYERFLRRHGA